MDYFANRGPDALPEFQKFLLDKKLVPEAKVSFFAYWVSRFLHYAQRHDFTATGYQESNIALRKRVGLISVSLHFLLFFRIRHGFRSKPK